MHNVQHKKEAYWFYRFLSTFYDNFVNPFFWNERMRQEALALARLDEPDLQVIDVGSGTGFTTQGIVRKVDPAQVVCVDQSPQQMRRAQRKPDLRNCTFRLGDAEDLAYPDDHFDRYVSAGSIEYWPEPQRGIAEAYRVLKPGGVALLIGPLRPRSRLARFLADTWMLFPEEEDYLTWFRQAGFRDVRKRYVAPSWVREEPYGIAIAGTKPAPGDSPARLTTDKTEDLGEPTSVSEAFGIGLRLLLGTLAGGFFIPLALLGLGRQWLRRLIGQAPDEAIDPLTIQQKRALAAIAAVGALLLWRNRRKS